MKTITWFLIGVVWANSLYAQFLQSPQVWESPAFDTFLTDSLRKHAAHNDTRAAFEAFTNQQDTLGSRYFDFRKIITHKNVKLNIAPVFFTENGFGTSGYTSYHAGGFLLYGNATNRTQFCIRTTGNASAIPAYAQNRFTETNTVPYGRTALWKQDNQQVWMDFRASVSHKVLDHFELELGNGTQKIGNAYRSLFLSGNVGNYPYFTTKVAVWRFNYFSTLAVLADYEHTVATEKLSHSYGSFHGLSIDLGKHLQFYLFESVVWSATDSIGKRGFDVSYANPIVFYRPVEFANGSPDNVIMGAGFELSLHRNFLVYGQGVLDEFILSQFKSQNGWWGNKYGFQTGAKWFRLPFIPQSRLLLEYNYLKPFTYSHDNNFTNYGHATSPLAHPAGANLTEIIVDFAYFPKAWEFRATGTLLKYGADTNEHSMGNNVFRSYSLRYSDQGHSMLQGELHTVQYLKAEASYTFNSSTNLKAGLRAEYRTELPLGVNYLNATVFIGTQLFKSNYDY